MRRYPKAMAVVGRKNSGKTTLLVGLAAELASRGHRVGAVKFSHHALDRADRDTGKLGEHAHAVVGMSPGETSLFLKEERSVQQMLPWMDVDVLLVEGGKNLASLPRILTGSEAEQDQELDQGLALAVWGPVRHQAARSRFPAEAWRPGHVPWVSAPRVELQGLRQSVLR